MDIYIIVVTQKCTLQWHCILSRKLRTDRYIAIPEKQKK